MGSANSLVGRFRNENLAKLISGAGKHVPCILCGLEVCPSPIPAIRPSDLRVLGILMKGPPKLYWWICERPMNDYNSEGLRDAW